MASLPQAPFAMLTNIAPQVHLRRLKLVKFSDVLHLHPQAFARIGIKHSPVCCTKLFSSEPSLVPYAPSGDDGKSFLEKTPNIFETLKSEDTAEKQVSNTEQLTETSNQPSEQSQFLKWPLWVVGPSLLLTTGMVPTLWIPISSVFLGPNIASFLSLIGLDCVFNLGATLFLLMADSCARPKSSTEGGGIKSKAPLSYQFWNLVATISGFVIPMIMLFGSEKGFLQPQLPPISFAVLLGPYLLLLSVQFLTEMLIWHWQSPVWLVTPIVYEAYRVLQLMRGLKLGVELSSPSWMMHTIRGLVCWWVLILGLQLMRVAWFAGFSARSQQQRQEPSAPASS